MKQEQQVRGGRSSDGKGSRIPSLGDDQLTDLLRHAV